MINKVTIDNFKLYKQEVEIPLRPLNLFTGINGKGKSTVLQVFLLLSQSAQKNRATNKVYLNGDNVKLGSFDDVKNNETIASAPIRFGFEYNGFSINYLLEAANLDSSELFIGLIKAKKDNFDFSLRREDDLYNASALTIDGESPAPETLFDLFLSDWATSQYSEQANLFAIKSALNIINVHYVSADRTGPKNYYENKSLGHFVSVGALGENTVNLLHHKATDKVADIILSGYCNLFDENIEEHSTTIEDNTNSWINKIFQGAKVQVEGIKGEDLLKLRINSDGKSTYFKPTNVGYGFSYSLPIIVAGLIAKPGEILIIENPEAHLHPYAQSIIAKFLCLVATSGVQVVIESHSEHILNGIRVAVKDKIIMGEETSVLYFDRRNNSFFDQISIDEDGGVDNWPKNFFDQSVNDLNYLLGI